MELLANAEQTPGYVHMDAAQWFHQEKLQ